jgi:hypothetical protein
MRSTRVSLTAILWRRWVWFVEMGQLGTIRSVIKYIRVNSGSLVPHSSRAVQGQGGLDRCDARLTCGIAVYDPGQSQAWNVSNVTTNSRPSGTESGVGCEWCDVAVANPG